MIGTLQQSDAYPVVLGLIVLIGACLTAAGAHRYQPYWACSCGATLMEYSDKAAVCPNGCRFS